MIPGCPSALYPRAAGSRGWIFGGEGSGFSLPSIISFFATIGFVAQWKHYQIIIFVDESAMNKLTKDRLLCGDFGERRYPV